MATTAPSRITDLAYNYRLDVNTAADPSTNYAEVIGKEEAKLIIDPETTPDRTYEDNGAMREEVIGYSWRVELKLKNSLNAAGTSRNTVHAFMRTKFLQLLTQMAAQSEFGIRWYHKDGITDEAFEGRVYVKAFPNDGGQGQDTISVVLMGQGTITPITNPAASQVPVVTSVVPATGAQAGGEPINVYGTHFTAATDVDFGADAADYVIVGDNHIVAVAPAHAAGTVQVKVTTGAGVSANTAADDYVYV